MKKLIVAVVIALSSVPAFAWDGYDYDSGSYVEIEQGQLVREGEEIEYYDYGSSEYRTGEVSEMNSTYGGVEVEIYDYDSGEYRTVEFDD